MRPMVLSVRSWIGSLSLTLAGWSGTLSICFKAWSVVPWYSVLTNCCSGGPCLLIPSCTKTLLFGSSAVTTALACVRSWNTSHGKRSASFGSFLDSIATRRRFQVVQRVSKLLMTRIAKKKRKMLRTTGRLKGPHSSQNTVDNVGSEPNTQGGHLPEFVGTLGFVSFPMC